MSIVLFTFFFSSRPTVYGVTFSTHQAMEHGLDWRVAYTEILDDLHVRRVRIPIYWSDVEWADDQFYTEDIDWMMNESLARNVDVTLVVGMKVPRWPECFIPHWTSPNDEHFDGQLLSFVEAMVTRYRAHPALVRWQVENEPLFFYGDCPTPNVDRVVAEATLVRELDPNHPILMTGSGEQALWVELAKPADEIGVSLYRFAWNPVIGPFVFPHTSRYYFIHSRIARLFVDRVIVTELQMEPWFEAGTGNLEGRHIPFTVSDFSEHIAYVEATGIDEVWLWGVEWWYRQAHDGDPSLWNAARELFSK